MKVKLAGKQYEIVFRRSIDACESRGQCDSPKLKNPKVYIQEGQTELDELDTLIHEMIHACSHEWLAEDWVNKTATDVARALYKLGWRKRVD